MGFTGFVLLVLALGFELLLLFPPVFVLPLLGKLALELVLGFTLVLLVLIFELVLGFVFGFVFRFVFVLLLLLVLEVFAGLVAFGLFCGLLGSTLLLLVVSLQMCLT